MDINKLNNADFRIVSLMNKRKIDYKLVLLVGFSVGSVYIICKLFDYFTGIYCKRQVICWIENHFKKIDNYIEN